MGASSRHEPLHLRVYFVRASDNRRMDVIFGRAVIFYATSSRVGDD